MHIYLPIRPKKGQIFKLYLALDGTGYFSYVPWSASSKIPYSRLVDMSSVSASSVVLSKDGGAFTQTTNTITTVESGGYIELTAEEMNADSIQLFLSYGSTASIYAYQMITIYTDSEEINYGNLRSLFSKLITIFK